MAEANDDPTPGNGLSQFQQVLIKQYTDEVASLMIFVTLGRLSQEEALRQHEALLVAFFGQATSSN